MENRRNGAETGCWHFAIKFLTPNPNISLDGNQKNNLVLLSIQVYMDLQDTKGG